MGTALRIAVLAALNMGGTFLLQWYVFVFFGPGRETDALFAGMTVPNLVVALTSAPVGNTLVPLLSRERDPRRRRQVAWAILIAITVVFGVVAAVLLLTVQWWAPVLAPGFEGASRDLLVETSRIQVLSVVFTAQYSVVWAMCQARRRFITVEISLMVSLVVAFVLMIWIAPIWGVLGIAWLNAGRALLQTALLLPALGAWVRPDWRSSALKDAWQRMWPLLVGGAYYKSDMLVDRFLSSMAPAGGLSLFHLGRQLYAAAQGILSKALIGPVVPSLAEFAEAKDWQVFMRTYRRRLFLVTGLIALGFFVYLGIGKILLGLLIGHGGVTDANLDLLHAILIGLVGFLLGAPGQIVASAFYAIGDTKTPTKASVLGYTLGLALKIGGFYSAGLVGLAVGTSAYYLINGLMLTTLLELRLKKLCAAQREAAKDD